MSDFLSRWRPLAVRYKSQVEALAPNELFPPPRDRDGRNSLVDLWQPEEPELESINPNARFEDDELNAIRPELRQLSAKREVVLLRWLRIWSRLPAPQVEGLREWSEDGANPVLVVLAAGCRVGLFEFEDGEWKQTTFGRSFAIAWRSGTPLEMFEKHWKPELSVELKAAVRWGWQVLREERECREVFLRLAECPTGLTLEELGDGLAGPGGTNTSLRALAAAAAIGAAWFTGWRWEPTMLGAYLAFHPQSALNSPSARAC
jgi:hypothetical protein